MKGSRTALTASDSDATALRNAIEQLALVRLTKGAKDLTRAQACGCQLQSCSNLTGNVLGSLNVSGELIDFGLGEFMTGGCKATATARCGTCNLPSSILEVDSDSFEVCADCGCDVHAGRSIDIRSRSLDSLVYLPLSTRFSSQISAFLLPKDATSAAMADCKLARMDVIAETAEVWFA